MGGPGRDAIFKVGINCVALGSAFDGVRRDSQGALCQRTERRVDLFVDLAQLEQRVRMSVQGAGERVRIEHFKNDPGVMLVVISQAQQIDHHRAHLGVASEEIGGLRHASRAHARSNHADEGTSDFRLNVSVIPRETGTHNRAETAGGLAGSPKKVKVGSRLGSDAELMCRSF